MKKYLTTVAAFGALTLSTAAWAETVIIGHFGSPTPMQVAASEGRFAQATGWDIEWRKFSSGTDVIAAMASGDIKVAELGSSPLAIAASQGIDLQLFMMAQVIGEAESLIVSDSSGITKLEDLRGKRVAVPVGSTAHFSLMGALNHAGIAESEVTIMNMPPDQIAAAWEQDALDAAFIWQPVQAKISETGSLLVGADKTAEWGWPTFDGWVVNTAFAAENADEMVAFARTMNEANLAYLNNKDAWTADSAEVQAIAAHVGASADQVPGILEGFTFLPLSEQVTATWLDGAAANAMQNTADFLAAAGRIDAAGEDYSGFVNLNIPNAAK
ncbi:MAG: taurine ABC transporter substrate-binding protein [Sulfitobacter sp.]